MKKYLQYLKKIIMILAIVILTLAVGVINLYKPNGYKIVADHKISAALFCFEYEQYPSDIDMLKAYLLRDCSRKEIYLENLKKILIFWYGYNCKYFVNKDKDKYLYVCIPDSAQKKVFLTTENGEIYELYLSSPEFSAADFKAPIDLIIRLRDSTQNNDFASYYIKQNLSKKFWQQIEEYQKSPNLSENFLEELTEEFNNLIKSSFYQQKIFEKIELSGETKKAFSQINRENSISDMCCLKKKLNRLLLQDIYPYELWDSKSLALKNNEIMLKLNNFKEICWREDNGSRIPIKYLKWQRKN